MMWESGLLALATTKWDKGLNEINAGVLEKDGSGEVESTGGPVSVGGSLQILTGVEFICS